MRPKGLKDVAVLAETKPHGTRLKYMAGCRCLLCRVANSQYETDRARARSTGEWNGLVCALRAQRHILRLSKQGVGRRAVSAACDVSATVIAAIRSGRRKQIRKRTQDKILGVTQQAVSDAALVPADEAWQQIHTLLEEGFTKAELARRLGIGGAGLQLGKDKILARTAARIDRLFRMLMKE